MSETTNTRLQHLEDQLALQHLINTYHWRADHFDWVGWADCFTADAEFEFATGFGTMRGRQAIHDTCKANMDHVYGVMQHVMVNLAFTITGADTATGHGNLIFTALPNAATPEVNFQSGGRYEWTFARTPDGWKIARARLDFIWTNGADTDAVFASGEREAAPA